MDGMGPIRDANLFSFVLREVEELVGIVEDPQGPFFTVDSDASRMLVPAAVRDEVPMDVPTPTPAKHPFVRHIRCERGIVAHELTHGSVLERHD